eukprot:216338_1
MATVIPDSEEKSDVPSESVDEKSRLSGSFIRRPSFLKRFGSAEPTPTLTRALSCPSSLNSAGITPGDSHHKRFVERSVSCFPLHPEMHPKNVHRARRPSLMSRGDYIKRQHISKLCSFYGISREEVEYFERYHKLIKIFGQGDFASPSEINAMHSKFEVPAPFIKIKPRNYFSDNASESERRQQHKLERVLGLTEDDYNAWKRYIHMTRNMDKVVKMLGTMPSFRDLVVFSQDPSTKNKPAPGSDVRPSSLPE